MTTDEVSVLLKTSDRLIDEVSLDFKRYLASEIDWRNRLVCLKGARGVGKTTLILQHMKEAFGVGSDKALYVRVKRSRTSRAPRNSSAATPTSCMRFRRPSRLVRCAKRCSSIRFERTTRSSIRESAISSLTENGISRSAARTRDLTRSRTFLIALSSTMMSKPAVETRSRCLAKKLWDDCPAKGSARIGKGRVWRGVDVPAVYAAIGLKPDLVLFENGRPSDPNAVVYTHRATAHGDLNRQIEVDEL